MIGFVILPRPLADGFALILFFIAAISDFFDGQIARRYNLESTLGKVLDPIGDKVLVLISFLLIMVFYDFPTWVVIPIGIIFFRELFITGLREYLAGKNLSIGVSFIAKLKAFVQMSTIVVVLFSGVVEGSDLSNSVNLDWICIGLICFSSIHTLYSGWQYFVKGLELLEEV